MMLAQRYGKRGHQERMTTRGLVVLVCVTGLLVLVLALELGTNFRDALVMAACTVAVAPLVAIIAAEAIRQIRRLARRWL
jgi:hypothetical protein